MTSRESGQEVLHVIPGFGSDGTLRGAERVASEILRGLENSEEWRPGLCVFRDPDPVDRSHGLRSCPVFLGYKGRDSDIEMAAGCVPRLRALIKRLQPRIVHSHLWPAAFAAGLAVLGTSVSHVIHIHDQRLWIVSKSAKHRCRRIIQRFVMALTQPWFIACSKASAVYCNGLVRRSDRGRLRVIYSGVPVEQLADIRHEERDNVVTGFAGALSSEKGPGDAIRAFAVSSRRLQNVVMLIAGSGNQEKDLRGLASELGVGDKVRFLGPVRDMKSFYRSIDILLFPSRNEGLPLTVLEAMAAGRAIIASKVGGICEAITDGREGFLVNPDDIETIVAVLSRLLIDKTLRQETGERARLKAQKNFRVDEMINQCFAFYRNILSRDRSA